MAKSIYSFCMIMASGCLALFQLYNYLKMSLIIHIFFNNESAEHANFHSGDFRFLFLTTLQSGNCSSGSCYRRDAVCVSWPVTGRI